jgi:hypothetical protein
VLSSLAVFETPSTQISFDKYQRSFQKKSATMVQTHNVFPQLGRSGRPRCGLNLLEPRLVESHATVIIPFDDRVLFIRSLNCAEFPGRLSEIAQTLDAISGIDFLAGSGGFCERRPLGTV